MATAQDVLDEIAAQKTVVGGLKVYTDDLRARLAAAIAANNGALTQAQLDQVFVDIGSNTKQAADAMVENTPNQP